MVVNFFQPLDFFSNDQQVVGYFLTRRLSKVSCKIPFIESIIFVLF